MQRSGIEPDDYKQRSYLSAVEAARYLDISVDEIHDMVKQKKIDAMISASGQMRFRLIDIKRFEEQKSPDGKIESKGIKQITDIKVNETLQRVVFGNSQEMEMIEDNSVHLMITSPPYFDAKMYARTQLDGNLGDIHDTTIWFEEIKKVWREVYRVLQPGRKAFINIMNLPIRDQANGFISLNLVGHTIDVCEELGFIFKRDIVWSKTNSVRAHFGSYPYPGGILINNSHEFILEFEKPCEYGSKKYLHLTQEQKETSRLDKEFWLSVKNSDVWQMAPEGSGDNRAHVAPFPRELPFKLIKAFSYVGETVLDPFMGSGTTLSVAADLGRNGIGFEIVEEIASQAINSIKAYQVKLY